MAVKKAGSTVIHMKIRARESKGGIVRRNQDVNVSTPKSARGLTKAFTQVLHGVEGEAKTVRRLLEDKGLRDRVDEGKIATQMSAAAAGKTDTIDIVSNTGRTLAKVNVDPESLSKTYAEVIKQMERHLVPRDLGFEVVDEADLGRQLAKLANTTPGATSPPPATHPKPPRKLPTK